MILSIKLSQFRGLLIASLVTISSASIANNSQVSWAANPAEAEKSSYVSLDQVLSEEQAGKPVDRTIGLKHDAIPAPGSENSGPVELLWHAGRLNVDGNWIDADELSEGKLPARVKQYLKLKSETKLDQAGHKKLAGYCEDNKLQDQANSHWYGVLAHDPQNAEARKALGFVNFGNRWISRSEILTVQASIKANEEACEKWIPTLRKWVKAIEGSDTKKRLDAIRQLKAVDDPSFVHPARLAVPLVAPGTATHLVQVIRKFQTRDAAQALAAIAIHDLSTQASRAAIDGLKNLPLESYAPDLLDLMAVETKVQEQLVSRPNGALVLQLVQEREWRNQRSLDWFDKQMWSPLTDRMNQRLALANSPTPDFNANSVGAFTPVNTVTVAAPNPIVIRETHREANQIVNAVKSQQDRENTIIRNRQQSIGTVLNSITKADVTSHDANTWWAWWDKHQESYAAGNKPVHYKYQSDTTSPIFTPEPTTQTSYRYDCLIAGTVISTETGFVPVEQVSIGDRVLSQDIKTGELSLKPVIRTAIRPPAPTNIIKLSSGESIQSTLGHPWWVIGKGWVKSKDLTAGMHLRTTKATVEILEVQQADVVQTYNLVVADNSSYFAGTDRVLSYDGNELVHTFQKVPGVPSDAKQSSVASVR